MPPLPLHSGLSATLQPEKGFSDICFWDKPELFSLCFSLEATPGRDGGAALGQGRCCCGGLVGPRSEATVPGQLQRRSICCAVAQVGFGGSGRSGGPTRCNLFLTGPDPQRCWGRSGAAAVLQRCDRALLCCSCQQPLASGTAHAFPRESWKELERIQPVLGRRQKL